MCVKFSDFSFFVGLLAGLWEFPSLKVEEEEDENSDHSIHKVLQSSCGLGVPAAVQSTPVGSVSTM